MVKEKIIKYTSSKVLLIYVVISVTLRFSSRDISHTYKDWNLFANLRIINYHIYHSDDYPFLLVDLGSERYAGLSTIQGAQFGNSFGKQYLMFHSNEMFYIICFGIYVM